MLSKRKILRGYDHTSTGGSHLDKMGVDIQVVAPAPGQCYYIVDPKIAENGPSPRQ